MRSYKIGVALVCICCVTAPAFAEVEKPVTASGAGVRADVKSNVKPNVKNSVKPNVKPEPRNIKTVDGVTFDSDNPSDMSKIKFNKKAYLKQIEEAFDGMDKNGDGVIDGAEVGDMQKKAGEENDEDTSDAEINQTLQVNEAPARPKASSNGSVGIPPVNEADLLKNK